MRSVTATTVLPIAIVVSAAADIVAMYLHVREVVYVFKPLTILLVIALAASGQPIGRVYRNLVVIALVFSLTGDICLMLPRTPRNFILPSLVSFLIAHLFYIAAFSWRVRWSVRQLPWLIPFALFGVLLCTFLWGGLGSMRIPVACYTAVISIMGWRAVCRIGTAGLARRGTMLAGAGAILFMTSDTCLALNRFGHSFEMAQLCILSTYFAAQALIALSVHDRP